MSIYFSGIIKRPGGVGEIIAKQLGLINLKPVKRVTIKFDPFGETARDARSFAHLISSPKIAKTNPDCVIKTEILCDRSEPLVIFNLLPAIAESQGVEKIILKGGKLNLVELLILANKHITVLAPKEEIVTSVQTKSLKKK